MKNKIWIRMFTVLLAALVMMGGLSVTAYAGGGEEIAEELPEETTPAETEEPKEPVALTPEGNLTLVDDIDGEVSEDKQFITVVTKSGNYFYIIVDRAAEGKNTVHFLNLVDEADLLALIEDGKTETPPVVEPMPDPDPSPEPEPEPEPKKGSNMGVILVIVFILAIGGGGAFYYFKVMKPKQSVKGGDTLDDFDFEDDEEEETELEVFETEREETY